MLKVLKEEKSFLNKEGKEIKYYNLFTIINLNGEDYKVKLTIDNNVEKSIVIKQCEEYKVNNK